MTDDIRWTIVGEETVEENQNVEELIEGMLAEEYPEVKVDTITTHGYSAAANGVSKTESGHSHAFCEVFTFDGATKTAGIEAIDWYAIGIS
ncbi:hypothetical protein C2R22_22050 (plasmid) [Salinigranum rubrum]|uniref:Uncharacterized protein n=1 Tax=Salinigranum rubrum TaxID=755307 RepID=A0A2I8VQP2_9EURY|nr:hypothetical protein [Salinigranum rubrum]AUV84241.1 hypothetical protein C2R22_22050 [Salinigranum rubrum]